MDTLEEEDECAICLVEDHNRKISLSQYFGCSCKQMVHASCIEEWNKRNIQFETLYCIVCRQPKERNRRFYMIGRAIIATYSPEIEILGRSRSNTGVQELEFRFCNVSCSCLACCFCFVAVTLILLFLIALFIAVF